MEQQQQVQANDDAAEYPCAECGAVNRFPRTRAGDDPKCGKCGGKVFPRKPVAVSDATWRSEVEDCPIPVLADFWAPWCGPCRTVAPTLERIAAERAGKLKVVKLNIDDNPRTAARHGVRSIPTMIVFRGPLQLDEIVGALPKSALDLRLGRFV